MLSSAILIGPQRRVKTVRQAVEALTPGKDDGAVLAVTAGWEERESEDEELREHLGRPLVNLALWERVERIFAADKVLFEAMRDRHATLRKVQELYRLRLQGLMDPLTELCRRVEAREEQGELLIPEQEGALGMVQALDQEHARRVAAIHHDFDVKWRPGERNAVVQQRQQVEEVLAGASCLLVAGGHGGVLLHRLRLFDLFRAYGDRPVIAWSAGAMVLCRRIVLFHDSPPQGSNYPEVMEAGFDLVPGLVALPHASKRLALDEVGRMMLLARRFAPAYCALLDPGARFEWDGKLWSATADSRVLGQQGVVEEVPA